MSQTRREALLLGGTVVGLAMTAPTWAASQTKPKLMTLGFSSYGMPKYSPEEAIKTTSDIGFDAIEIDTAAGRNADPFKLTAARQKKIRDLLRRTKLQLSSLMAHITPTSKGRPAADNLTRLRATAELGLTLSPDAAPLVQTVLGGGRWAEKKNMFVDRLGRWLEIANSRKVTIAIKPHRGGALSRPSEAVWLARQLGQPKRLRMVYDYSHYAFRDMPLAETIKTAIDLTAHVAVKDAVKMGAKYRFAIAGESGTFDYVPLLRQFHQGGYRGDISCEVSSQVWRQANYDPLKAARKCYANLSKAFLKANIQRMG